MDLDELLLEAQTPDRVRGRLLHGAATLIGRIERREAARAQSDG